MLELSQLPPTSDGRQLYLEGFGGDTSNTAVAAARQGAKVGYISAVGCDMGGDALMRLWQSEGIDTSTVLKKADCPTAIYIVVRENDGHKFLFYRKGSAAASYGPKDLPKRVITSARILYASGISQGISDSAADAVFSAIETARSAKVAVAYDTNYRRGLWPAARAAAVVHAAVGQADYVFASQEDAEALTGHCKADWIIDFYLRLGPQTVVLKQGSAGALLATPHIRVHISPPKVHTVDSTGAGDVFSGAFLARLLAGDCAEAAAHYGVVAAAFSTTGYGAVTPIPREADVAQAMKSLPSKVGAVSK